MRWREDERVMERMREWGRENRGEEHKWVRWLCSDFLGG